MDCSSSGTAIFAFVNVQNVESGDIMNFYSPYLHHRDEFSSSAWYTASLRAVPYDNVSIAILGM